MPVLPDGRRYTPIDRPEDRIPDLSDAFLRWAERVDATDKPRRPAPARTAAAPAGGAYDPLAAFDLPSPGVAGSPEGEPDMSPIPEGRRNDTLYRWGYGRWKNHPEERGADRAGHHGTRTDQRAARSRDASDREKREKFGGRRPMTGMSTDEWRLLVSTRATGRGDRTAGRDDNSCGALIDGRGERHTAFIDHMPEHPSDEYRQLHEWADGYGWMLTPAAGRLADRIIDGMGPHPRPPSRPRSPPAIPTG